MPGGHSWEGHSRAWGQQQQRRPSPSTPEAEYQLLWGSEGGPPCWISKALQKYEAQGYLHDILVPDHGQLYRLKAVP